MNTLLWIAGGVVALATLWTILACFMLARTVTRFGSDRGPQWWEHVMIAPLKAISWFVRLHRRRG